MRALFSVAVVLLGMITRVAPTFAHGMRTAYLEVNERASGSALTLWRLSFPDERATPVFPEGCDVSPTGAATPNVKSFLLHCDGPLAGRTLAVRGLGPIVTEVIVRVILSDGTIASQVLTPAAPSWSIPERQSPWRVAGQYVRLGVWHIMTGPDHLLFLLALVLYVRRWRAILITETAFTLSHSLSFSATALGLIHVSSVAAEACIALSLVLVALEVGRGDLPPPRPWKGPAIALVFGLVHGLGFAGGLADIGLPDGAVAAALVSFGLGIEVGQIGFLAVVGLVMLLAARAQIVPRLALAGSYAVGVTGAFWLFQRLWICWA